MQRKGAVVAAVVSAACFGTMAIIVRLMYERGAEPLQVLAWRFGVAALLLGGYTALTRPRALRVPAADLGRYVVLSVFGYGAASLCFFFALRYADAAVIAILLYTYPAMVVLAELVIERTRPTGGRAAAVLMTFAGCVFVVDPFGGELSVRPLGIMLGLGAAAAYASFSMLSHRLMRTRSRTVLMTYLFVFTSLFAALVAVVTGARLVPSGWDLQLWGLFGLLVLVPTSIAIVFYLQAVRALGASQAAIVSAFEPVFTLVLAVLILGESLHPGQLAGAALVLGGVFVAETTAVSADEAAVL